METLMWIALVVPAWLVLAVVIGLAVGKTIRRRDKQVPPSRPDK